MICIPRWNGTKLLVGLLLLGFAGSAAAQQPTQAQASAIKQSCRTDYQSYCSSVPTGGSAALQCLQQHISSLSGACQTAVNAATGGSPAQASKTEPSGAQPSPPPPPTSMRQKAALMRRYCGRDFQAYCHGVQPGGGRVMACLAQNEARLSPPCKRALSETQEAH